jgi:hypothetical protein
MKRKAEIVEAPVPSAGVAMRSNKLVNTDAQGRPVAARPSPLGRGLHARCIDGGEAPVSSKSGALSSHGAASRFLGHRDRGV